MISSPMSIPGVVDQLEAMEGGLGLSELNVRDREGEETGSRHASDTDMVAVEVIN